MFRRGDRTVVDWFVEDLDSCNGKQTTEAPEKGSSRCGALFLATEALDKARSCWSHPDKLASRQGEGEESRMRRQ